ncbi:proline-rich protein 36-like [Schistocerca nitens]|uniref:proline-rich protein 36-like n=1 Tax=Schistocerca nitens TaxID=7011 RepID=UPI002118D98C|nr:proline-rich protein 36-like [Schistocerca nitens]
MDTRAALLWAVLLAASVSGGQEAECVGGCPQGSRREGRSLDLLSGLTGFLGGGDDEAGAPDPLKYPIWKVHKYHGIDLRPVQVVDVRSPYKPPEPKQVYPPAYGPPAYGPPQYPVTGYQPPAGTSFSATSDTFTASEGGSNGDTNGGSGGGGSPLSALISLLPLINNLVSLKSGKFGGSGNGDASGGSPLEALGSLSGLLESASGPINKKVQAVQAVSSLLPVLQQLKHSKPVGFRTSLAVGRGFDPNRVRRSPQRISKRSLLLLPKKLAVLGAISKLQKIKSGKKEPFSLFNPFSFIPGPFELVKEGLKTVLPSFVSGLLGFDDEEEEEPGPPGPAGPPLPPGSYLDTSALPVLPGLPPIPIKTGLFGFGLPPKFIFQPVAGGQPYVSVRYPQNGASPPEEDTGTQYADGPVPYSAPYEYPPQPPPPPPQYGAPVYSPPVYSPPPYGADQLPRSPPPEPDSKPEPAVAYHASQVIPQLQIQISPYPLSQAQHDNGYGAPSPGYGPPGPSYGPPSATYAPPLEPPPMEEQLVSQEQEVEVPERPEARYPQAVPLEPSTEPPAPPQLPPSPAPYPPAPPPPPYPPAGLPHQPFSPPDSYGSNLDYSPPSFSHDGGYAPQQFGPDDGTYYPGPSLPYSANEIHDPLASPSEVSSFAAFRNSQPYSPEIFNSEDSFVVST